MAFKFAFVLAVVCVAQGLALRPMGRPFQAPCKVDSEISQVFHEAAEDMDEMREAFTVDIADAYSKGTDPQVVIACFREQKDNYIKLGERIYQLMQEGAAKLAEKYGDKFASYGKRMAEPMNKIANAMKEFPVKMMEYIEKSEFAKAFEYAKQTRKTIDENAKLVAEVIEEMRVEIPEAAKMAEGIARGIRIQATKGWKLISMAVRKCIEAGGPNKNAEESQEE